MNRKTLDSLCNDASQRSVPLIARRDEIIELKWVEPPRPQASFGLVGNWVNVRNEVKGPSTTLLIPFQMESLGWVKPESVRLFRFDARKNRFVKVRDAALHSKHSVIYAAIDQPGVYGLIGLHTHPLVLETIRQLCESGPIVRALPETKQRAFRDRLCEVILCARDMDQLLESRDELADLAKSFGGDVPRDMPPPLPRPARPGETLCDRCHGVDIIDLPECQILDEPVLHRPCAQAKWESVGPKHISGAMRQVVVDPTDRRRLYAVAANGGIWRLDNVDNYPTEVWRPLTDNLNNQRFRTMAVAPGGGRFLYAANVVKELWVDPIKVYSEIYRSPNRGITWRAVHQADMGVVHRLIVHPANRNTVFAATSTGLWRQSTTVGAWTNLFADDCLDMALDPEDSSIVYLAVRSKGVFKSFTSGADWTADPILDFNSAAAGSGRRVIKIALGVRNADQSLQTSTTRTVAVRFGNEICVNQPSGGGGASAWRRVVPVTPPPPQTDNAPALLAGGSERRSDTDPTRDNEWCNCLAVDPFDSDHILVGSVSLLESADGGQNWAARSLPHEDEHGIAFDPETQDLVYIANDGGVFSSINGGTNWPNMSLAHTGRATGRGLNLASGLVTSELRHSTVRGGRCVAAIDHTGYVLSEDFDNRWQFLFNGPDSSARHGGHENGYVYSCPASLDRYYVFNMRADQDSAGTIGRLAQWDFTRTNGLVDPPASPFINLSNMVAFSRIVDDLMGRFPTLDRFFPEDALFRGYLPGPFAIRLSGSPGERLILFGTAVSGGSSTIQSLRLATNGNTVTASATEATNAVEPFYAITFVPNDPDRAFAITESGELFERDFSTAGQFASVARWDIPTGDLFVSRIIASTKPALRLYALSQHGIGRFDDASREWETVYEWPELNEMLLSLTAHPARDNTLFLGTTRGAYLSEDAGDSWHSYRLGLPRVPVNELSFDEGYLYAATLGRGLWRCKPCPR